MCDLSVSLEWSPRPRWGWLVTTLAWVAMSMVPVSAKELPELLKAKRIVFLGDSNTYAGGYIAWIEAQLRHSNYSPLPELLNLGLPSETCSGLSEPEHPFPRPNVHERVGRVLEQLHPDLVVVCYGMNDGIYYPFSEQRFQTFQQGVIELIEKIRASGAKVVLMTPPAFDPQPMRKQGKLLPESAEKFAWFAIYEHYDDVMKKYAAWEMTQAKRVDLVVDLQQPVEDYSRNQRKTNPDFQMSPDGVHVDQVGHAIIGRAFLASQGMTGLEDPPPELLQRVTQRQQILRDAWLTRTGHQRPGIAAGLPLDEAQKQADAILLGPNATR